MKIFAEIKSNSNSEPDLELSCISRRVTTSVRSAPEAICRDWNCEKVAESEKCDNPCVKPSTSEISFVFLAS